MNGLFLANAPLTEEAKGLGLTAELQDSCRVVYEKDPKGEGYVFHSLWHPQGEYGEDHIIMPVGSTYNGLTGVIPAGTEFANISGSSHDPKYPHPRNPSWSISWIELIRRAYRAKDEDYIDECCAERNKIYFTDPREGEKETAIECTNGGVGGNTKETYMQGAHVILGTENKSPGRDANVLLVPLCIAHNTCEAMGGYGTGYYMKLGRALRAVKLKGYLKPPVPGTLP